MYVVKKILFPKGVVSYASQQEKKYQIDLEYTHIFLFLKEKEKRPITFLIMQSALFFSPFSYAQITS